MLPHFQAFLLLAPASTIQALCCCGELLHPSLRSRSAGVLSILASCAHLSCLCSCFSCSRTFSLFYCWHRQAAHKRCAAVVSSFTFHLSLRSRSICWRFGPCCARLVSILCLCLSSQAPAPQGFLTAIIGKQHTGAACAAEVSSLTFHLSLPFELASRATGVALFTRVRFLRARFSSNVVLFRVVGPYVHGRHLAEVVE
jgi:hypothetical protein